MKKIISIAVTSICTICISVSAFGATKNTYKYYTPASIVCSESFSSILRDCIEKLKLECGQVPSVPDFDENLTEKPVVPEKPESPDNSDTPDVPEIEESTPAATNQSEKEAAFAAEVIRLTNIERSKNGLGELTQDMTTQAAAQVRSKEQIQSFSHTRPNGSSCFSVLDEFGVSYRGAGENIAFGQKTPEEVVNAWMTSPGHKANIMSKNFSEIGVGCHIAENGTIYWTQLFTY